MKIIVSLLIAGGLLAAEHAFAQIDRMPNALDEGRALGRGSASSIPDAIRLPEVDGSAENVVPHYNDTPDGRYDGGRGNTNPAGTQQVLDCAAATPEQLAGYAGKQCDATNFLTRNAATRPSVSIERTDPLLTGARARASQGRLIGLPSTMTGIPDGGAQCETVINPGGEVHQTTVCHEQGVMNEQACTVGQVIEVDAAYRYECRRTPLQIETATCNRSLIVTCEPQRDGCDSGGIVPGSTQGDMRVWFGPSGGGSYTLEFGTFADNYWGGYASVFDRSLQFNIANRDGVTQFRLINASFDDWILVAVNGHTVYVGPYGGDRLEVVKRGGGRNGSTTQIQYAANSFGNPELDTDWKRSLDIDIRPYLVTGGNSIFMRTIVTDRGEGAIRIDARMACPRNCTDSWNDQCAALQERSR